MLRLLTDEVLREYAESELSNQQINNVSVVILANIELFHVNRNEDENNTAAEAADDTREE